MLRSLRCAAGLLLLAACSRAPAPREESAGDSAAAAARMTGAASPSLRHAPPQATAPAVRPRPERCLPGEPYAPPSALALEAGGALGEEANGRALACAEEALRISPRLVTALSARAGALSALGRLEEARLAYARALAIDPNDRSALLGAAELHVRQLGASRDALEVGLEYALRGARVAAQPPRRDRELAGRLELVAGMAQNDLGRSDLALGHLERAIASLPGDPDAIYERGVALFELCRFDEARRSFERALALAPDDPWALHQLGLLAERRGDRLRAESLLAKARGLAPGEFRTDLAIDERAFQSELEAAVAELPEQERRALALAPVEIGELPEERDLLAVDPPLSPSILALYRGPSLDERCAPGEGARCRSIVFYRRNLLRFVRSREELAREVRTTLLHELGHLHGESDDELRDRGLE